MLKLQVMSVEDKRIFLLTAKLTFPPSVTQPTATSAGYMLPFCEIPSPTQPDVKNKEEKHYRQLDQYVYMTTGNNDSTLKM